MEGYNHASSIEDMVYLTVQGQRLKVIKVLIYEGRGFIGTVDKIPKSNVTELLAIVGNAARDTRVT